MGRIKDSFERAENQESKTLITYYVAGDNNLNFSKKVFLSLLSHADIIEIGVPSRILWLKDLLFSALMREH